jgi:hypothetical protein
MLRTFEKFWPLVQVNQPVPRRPLVGAAIALPAHALLQSRRERARACLDAPAQRLRPQSRECAACARAGCVWEVFARASPIAPGATRSVRRRPYLNCSTSCMPPFVRGHANSLLFLIKVGFSSTKKVYSRGDWHKAKFKRSYSEINDF